MSVFASALVVDMALGGSFRQLVSAGAPTAWWRFANRTGTSARDSSGNGHHGTIVGGVTLGADATIPDGGFSYQFNGVDGRITLSTLAATGTTLSIEAWLKPGSGGSGGSTYQSAVLADGAASYWRMNQSSGNSADSADSVTATVVGTPSYSQAGPLSDGSTAIRLHGATDYFTCGDNYDFAGTSSFSVEFWINPTANHATVFERILSKEETDGSGRQGWSIGIDPADQAVPRCIFFNRWLNGVSQDLRTAHQLVIGVWTHVVCTYDGTNLRVYINGVLDTNAPAASTHSMINHAVALHLGRRSNTSTAFLNATISDVAIYNTVLTVTQAAAHYALRTATTANQTIFSNTDGTVRLELDANRIPNMVYSAASHLASEALADGAWSHLLVSMAAGAGTFYINGVAKGTFASFVTFTPTRIGRYDTAAPFSGSIDELVLYPTALSASAATDHYNAGVWTDVSADVLSAEPLTLRYGIAGNGPTDRLADPGVADFYLRNDDGNSGGLLGYYSPNHVNVRSGFTYGILTRISLTYSGGTYPRFIGKIAHIDPEPGAQKSRRTRVILTDIMADFVDSDLRNVTLQLNQQEDDLLLTLLEALPVTAQPLGVDFDAGMDTVPYAFDDLGSGEKAIRSAGDLTVSSVGFLYPDSYGIAHYENRLARQTSTSLWTFDNDMVGLVVPTSLDGVFNRFRLAAHPKRIDTAATTVLFSIPVASAANPATMNIDPGATVEHWGDYFNPANVKQAIGGTAQVAPVATTDYLANTLADGTGTNKTANVTVTATFFASTVKFTITNNDAAVVHITKLQVRGKGLYDESPQTVEAMSEQPYGERPLTIDLPYQSDLHVAQDLASYLLTQYENPSSQAHSLTFDAQRSHAHMLAALQAQIGDRLTITETVTGLTGLDVFIQSIRLDVKQPLLITATFTLSPAIFASVEDTWILEEAGSSLGVNTYLGFG